MVFTVTGSIFLGAISIVGSTIPDMVELGPGRMIFRKHRGMSHNPFFWLASCLVSYLILTTWTSQIPQGKILGYSLTVGNIVQAAFIGIFAGIFSHLLTDALSKSGIPLWGNRKLALGLYKTFMPSEHIVSGIILFICLTVVILRGILTNGK